MGRAERILVFAVFGVIALILGITAFLPEQPVSGGQKVAAPAAGQPGGPAANGQGSTAQAPAGGNAATLGLTPVERLLQADRETPGPGPGEKKDDSKASDVSGNLRSLEVGAPGPVGGPPLRYGVQHPSNPNYLVVKVRGGETFGQIVERECGSLQHYMEQAIALNEAVEPNNIRVGQELVLPFVAEDQLPRRAPRNSQPVFHDAVSNGDDKRAGKESDAGAVHMTFPRGEDAKPATEPKAAPRDKSTAGASLAAAQATSYTVKKGDTLWGLAEKKWGKGKAKSKIQEILALNTGTLKSESDLRAGQVIKLP